MMGAAEWVGYSSSPTVAPSYSSSFQTYDQSGMLPAVLPNESYNLTDYGSMGQNAASYGGSQFTSLTSWSNEMDQYNNTYGYNSYQYSCQPPPAQTQYPPPTVPPGQPTMLLYPQVYSTVNQNQIHLHLHGTDKLVEQYLGGAAISSSGGGSSGITASDNNPFSVVGNCNNQRAISDIPMISQSEEIKHQEQTVDQDAGDQSVWRPYEKSINYM
jgi:RUNX transcription factor Lozenge